MTSPILSQRNIRIFFLLLTALVGLWILWPTLNYQPIFAPGDHGRDLYTFERTGMGDQPYQDYYWCYGPLMPYVGALFFKIFGASLQTAYAMKQLFFWIAGLLFFRILCFIMVPSFAFLAAASYYLLQSDITHTYTYTLGFVLSLSIAYLMFSYAQQMKPRFIVGAVLCAFFLALIKLHFGIAFLFYIVGGVLLIELTNKSALLSKNIFFYLIVLVAVPAIAIGIYFYFLRGLPWYEIGNAMPYFPRYSQQNQGRFLGSGFLTWYAEKTPHLNLFIIFPFLAGLVHIFSRPDAKTKVFVPISLLFFGYCVTMIEKWMGGQGYSEWWAQPFLFLLFFAIVGYIFNHPPRWLKLLFFGACLLAVFQYAMNYHNKIYVDRASSVYMAHPKMKMYIGNDRMWVNTVLTTTTILNRVVPPDETFFALPYDCVYYYLTGKRTPTRAMAIFKISNIPQEQENQIISDLEAKHVNWIVLSNRFSANEPGLGTLGKTHCKILWDYITNNFDPVAKLGLWGFEPGWAWNHGTLILKRKVHI